MILTQLSMVTNEIKTFLKMKTKVGKIMLKCIKTLILKILVRTYIKMIYKELMSIAWHPLR